jgi:hypothetical protein
MAATPTVTDWKKEWFEIEDATYLNTSAHAPMPRVTLRAVQNSIEANKFPHHRFFKAQAKGSHTNRHAGYGHHHSTR